MIENGQSVLPFNQYNGHNLVVTLRGFRRRGPRSAPQFVATGGLLHAYNPHTNEPLVVHEYPQPPEWAFGEDDPDASVPTPINSTDIPFEEQVAGYVEHTAQVLYDLILDTAEMQRVAQRFKHRKNPSKRIADDLDDERAQANAFFGEVLEHYCLNMGANAAEALSQWLAEVAHTLDTPGSPALDSSAREDTQGRYASLRF